jgi:hypothetical protein
MELSGQFHAPATLLPGKQPPLLPIVQEVDWAAEPVWTLWIPYGNRTLAPQSPNLAAILNELSMLYTVQ